jgi:two-component system NtrC family sensor kinase
MIAGISLRRRSRRARAESTHSLSAGRGLRTGRGSPAAASAWVRRHGVALTVLLGLMLIGLLALAQSGIAFLAFARFGASFDQVADINLPNLIAASRLAELSQSLVAQASELAAAGSQTRRQEIMDRLDHRLTALAHALDRAAIDPQQRRDVRAQLDGLATNLKALNGFVRQRIDADKAFASVMARLPALAARVRQVVDKVLSGEGSGEPGVVAAADRSRLIAWSAAGLESVTLMLATPAIGTRSRLERVNAELQMLVTRMAGLRDRLSPQLRQKIDALHDDIARFGVGDHGILRARQAQIEAGMAIETALRFINQAIDRFVATVSVILTGTQHEIRSRSAALDRTVSSFDFLIVVTATLSVVAGAAVFAYVRRAVIVRLKHVQDYMRAQVEGQPAEMTTNGADEIAEIAEATQVFVTRIANREAVLRQRTRELSEAFERQTAIAELLQIINSSPGDLGPVFDAVLDKATRLCAASFGALTLYRGDDLHEAVALLGMPPSLDDLIGNRTYLGPETGMGRLAHGERIAHIADARDDEGYRQGNPVWRTLVDVAGARTSLAVPLRKDGALLGAFTICRREVRPFSDQQIALLESFAAQTVIAMDNARLLDEIRRHQAELRVTFDNMGDGVAMFDADLRLAAWNRNFQRILDLPDALLEQRPSLADYVRYLATHGEYGAVDAEAEIRRLTEMAGRQWSAERTRPDGRVIEVRHNPVPGGGFVLIYGDITERKRAEAEIHAARDAAERALAELKAAQASLLHAQKMAALGQLTAGIAHEIKNPLNFVNNFAGLSIELLDELKEAAAPAIDALGDDTRAEIDETIAMLTGNLDKIAEHGKRADGIVQSMLAHSRGASGERQPVDVNALVEEALNLAYHGARAQDQSFNITLERDLDNAAAPIALVPQDVMRVFLNLVGNGFYAATKRARQEGQGFRPVLKVTTRDLGNAVEVKVRDNGTGIAPEHRDRLFQPFFTTKPTGEGTGLGLSISYDIVTQQHGGAITVDSEPGAFTEFTVRLPRRSKQHFTAQDAGDAQRTQ